MKLGRRWALQSTICAVLVIVILLVVVDYELRQYSIEVAEEKARIIVQHKQDIINYVTHGIQPSISHLNDEADSLSIGSAPGWMTAGYVNKRIADYFKRFSSDQYYFKNAAVNARDARNEADLYEKKFLEKACLNSEGGPCSEVIEFEGKPYYRYMQAQHIRFAKACMSCHGSPENAPADLVARYGRDRGFNKKVGDVSSILSIRIPLEETYRGIDRIILGLFALCAAFFAVIFFFQLFIAKRSMVTPIKRITAESTAITNGERPPGGKLTLSGGDELSELASAFSGMSQKFAHSQDSLEALLKERNEQLLELREQTQAYLDIAAVMLIAFDCSGVITMINAKGREILGLSLDEAIGLNWFEHFSSNEKKEFFQLLLRKDIAVENHETTIVTRSGEMRSIDFYSILLRDSSGAVRGRLCSGTDITEQKQAEMFFLNSIERFKDIFEQAPIGYQLLDDRGALLEVNQTWLDYLGYKKGEVLGKFFIGFLSPAGQLCFEEKFSYVKATGGVLAAELEVLKKDGASVLMAIDGRISSADNDSCKKIHCILHDVSHERKIEAEKAKLEEQLRQAQRMETVGAMAGGIAHDFNNILAVILGNAEMAREDIPAGNPAIANIDEVLKASERAKSLIKQILSFSRKEKMRLVPVHPQLLVREALKFLRSTTPSSISIVQDISPDCGVVLLDPVQLHQLVMNLVINAVHAIEDRGEVVVRMQGVHLNNADFDQLALTTPCARAEGEYVQLSVTDSGVGMGRERIKRIFDLFYTTKDAGKGTGMGLALVHEIVKIHSGFISVESDLGRGSSFNVYLPVTAEEETPQIEGSSEVITGTERILFVDDEKSILTMGQHMLEGMGYRVVSESSSQRALELFKADANGFDLLITDQTMPNMSGTELIEEVLKVRADMRIILCSGYSFKVSAEDVKVQGISKYMTKPYGKKILSASVREVLANKS
ncbi:c-type heme family protein [Desulfotalea psychrophila]|nr:DUF3365 domain-containing protein [Desulfotalea psychrophila]